MLLCVLILGAAVLAVHVAGGEPAVSWIAFGAAATAIAFVGGLIALASARRLRDITTAAQSLASGRLDARAGVEDDAFSPLASAMNTAAATFERVIASLQTQRAQLEALLNASSDATVAVDGDGAIVYWNDAAARLFAEGGGPAIGRPFIESVRDHDLNGLMIAAARRGERSVRVVPYGQSQRWLQATAVPIEEGGGSWAALAVFHDLTEVRRLDSMRRDFVSNVSHELRTPLAGIRAAAETLHEGALDDPDAARQFLGHILRETDRMTQLVEELLELSRIESGAAPLHFGALDAGELARDAVRRFAQQAERARIRLTSDVTADALPVIGDGERLEQALGNLVANAIRFTPEQGSITVAAAAEDGSRVAISVADTGVGIEPEDQGRVFERFYKVDRGRARGGTGLGLAIVKHIALAHGGSVTVDSRPNRGSTFTIHLPAK